MTSGDSAGKPGSGSPGAGREFAIATELLDDSASGWSNLGFWPAPDYASACAALARECGRAAALDSGDSLLELACGRGAGLLLWQREFGVHRVAGIDRQLASVTKAGLRVPGVTVAHARFDALPLPAALAAGSYSAVICVDAAYHAETPSAFAAVAAAALAADGRLAFTTLLQGPARALHATRLLRFCLRLAHVPVLPSAADWQEALTAAGFSDLRFRHLDGAVLGGFPDYVDERARQLPPAARRNAGWLKIRLAAALCRHAHRRGLLHYSLVLARHPGAGRSDPSTRSLP